MPPAKRPVPKKAAPKKDVKKPVKAATVKTAYQLAISSAKPASAKLKVKPYDAKWKADVAKKSKRSGLDKFAEGAMAFSPLGGIKYAAEAISGRDLSAPAGSKKKTSRVNALANTALVALPVGRAFKGAKALKKARDAKKVYTAKEKFIKDSKINKANTTKVYSAKKRERGN